MSNYYPDSMKVVPENKEIKLLATGPNLDKATKIAYAVGREYFKSIVIALIESETSFKTKKWVDHGYAGIQTFNGTGSDQKSNIPQALIDHSQIVGKSRTGGSMMGWTHESKDGSYSLAASAVASYLLNRSARNVKTGQEIDKRTAFVALAKAIKQWRGIKNLSGTSTDKVIYARTGWSPAKQLMS